MKKRNVLLFTVIAVALVLLLPGTALANLPGATYYVDDSATTGANNGATWQDAFTDLQSALTAAVAGDQIWVAAGTYKPSATIDGSLDPRTAAFSLTSGVRIYGGFEGDEKVLKKRHLDPSLTVLSGDIGVTGNDTDNSYHVVYADGVTGAVLDGFTVTGGRAVGSPLGSTYVRDMCGAGMHNNNSSLTVSNCTFTNNRVAGGTGSYAFGGGMYNMNSAPTVTNCTFSGNQVGINSLHAWGRGGMYNDGGMPTVDSCTFAANSAGNGGGMFNLSSAPTVTNCIFSGNWSTWGDGRGAGMFNFGGRPTILNDTVYMNGWRLLPDTYPAPRLRPYTAQGNAKADGGIRAWLHAELPVGPYRL